jgi:hypothetical protein
VATDYSTESALPMAQGGDIVDVAVLRLLRDELAGRVFTVTTSGALPAVASAGHPAYLSDIEALAIKGSAWRYVDLIPQTQAGGRAHVRRQRHDAGHWRRDLGAVHASRAGGPLVGAG